LLIPKRGQNSWPAKEMGCDLKLGKREFPCPFTWIKATPWEKRDQPLWENLINIITPLGAKKTKNGNKKKLAQINGTESSTCCDRIWIA